MNLINGRVAKIIDEYRVVLNIGYNKNVEEDMRFIIYELGDEIHDPETGENLGNYENVKAKVKIVNVAERFSTAESDETTPIGSLSNYTAAIASVMGREELKKLPIDETIKDDISKFQSKKIIKVGDLVRQILI